MRHCMLPLGTDAASSGDLKAPLMPWMSMKMERGSSCGAPTTARIKAHVQVVSGLCEHQFHLGWTWVCGVDSKAYGQLRSCSLTQRVMEWKGNALPAAMPRRWPRTLTCSERGSPTPKSANHCTTTKVIDFLSGHFQWDCLAGRD